MRVFNLAEELEKERKKNKELEEKRIKDNYFIGGLSREIKELQENIKIALEMCKEKQDRIDSAINNIEKVLNMYEEVKDKELLTNAVVHIECYKELYDLLKGE